MGWGIAVVTPMALDLSMIANTFNGLWDRDNVGRIMIDPSKGSTIVSPFASSVTRCRNSATGSTFTLSGSGRKYITSPSGMEATITTQDARLLITAHSSLRLNSADATAAGRQPAQIAFGIEVDGRVVWHSGWERVIIRTDAGPMPLDTDIAFPRATVQVDVGAGSHYIALFADYAIGVGTGGADVNPSACRFLKTSMLIEEMRR